MSLASQGATLPARHPNTGSKALLCTNFHKIHKHVYQCNQGIYLLLWYVYF